MKQELIFTEFENAPETGKVFDLITVPFNKTEIKFLERNGCDDLSGHNKLYTPVDDLAIVKLNIHGKKHVAAVSYDYVYIFNADVTVKQALIEVIDHFGLDEEEED